MHASWVLLPQQQTGFDIEDPDSDYGAGAARIDFAHMDDLLVVTRPVDDPAAGGRERRDTGARPGLGFRLVTRRCAGNPDPAFTRLGQMTGRDAERRSGTRTAIYLWPPHVPTGRGRGIEDDGSHGVRAGVGN